MEPAALITVVVLVAMVVGLVSGRLSPPSGVVGATAVLFAAGVIDAAEAFAGFANPAPITVAGLYVVAAAIERTGAIGPVVAWMLGRPRSTRRDLARLVVPAAGASAVVANTPIVAMLTPAVTRWADVHRRSASLSLIPLSYATILGGSLTAIGTSTNLVASGLLQGAGQEPLGLFELARVGLPAVVVGVAAIVALGPVVLPARRRWSGTGSDLDPGAAQSSPPPADAARPTTTTAKAPLALAALASVVVLPAFGWLSIARATVAAAVAVVAVGILRPREARDAIDVNVVLMIAGAFGLGAAVEGSGLAAAGATVILDGLGWAGTAGAVIGLLVTTIVLTELITNAAAVALVFPIALAVADDTEIDPRLLLIGLAVAASASFLTPIGYQTNTMVYEPGRYRFTDYLRLGAPLSVITVATVTGAVLMG